MPSWLKPGEDSDFVRVRVRGAFLRTGERQFIDGQRVDEAVARPLVEDPTAALIMGVDIARQGEDQSVIHAPGANTRPPSRRTLRPSPRRQFPSCLLVLVIRSYGSLRLRF